jgi:hypothetical protein
VAQLQSLIDAHGDLPVYVRDADTEWRLPVGLVYQSAAESDEGAEQFEIRTDYYGEPRGYIAPEDV